MIKIICVCGARPNFMKIAPLMQAFNSAGCFDTVLVHTGQHYDKEMSTLFFDELSIPRPDINLGVGSGSHAVQTADIMKGFEPIVQGHKPDYVLVVGDVNSTVACGLVSVKLGVKVIHVEAGLRSFDRTMPEEINRVLTDAISDVLFVTEASAVDNLTKEGISPDKIEFVGNVMIDTLMTNRTKATHSGILEQLDIKPNHYGVITLHRPSNVDDRSSLLKILAAFKVIQQEIPLIFPLHPRTRKNLRPLLETDIGQMSNLKLMDPLGYLDFLRLMSDAAVVLTDSGGIQEETTILGVPCLTLRNNTERPVTLTHGTNRLVPLRTDEIIQAFQGAMQGTESNKKPAPPLWDGKAAERIVSILMQRTR